MVRRENPPPPPAVAQEPLPWSVPVAVGAVPEDGRHVDLVADEAVRAAILRSAGELGGLNGISRLTAKFDLARHGDEGLHVRGSVSATVGQACVVTLEPLENEVREDIDLLFLPPSAITPPSEDDSEEAEPPEPIVNGTVDLGRIATEFLLLGIDPYPRKTGVAFESGLAADPEEKPFAALAALRKGRTDDES